jgi:teichoic acid transport system permease protein
MLTSLKEIAGSHIRYGRRLGHAAIATLQEKNLSTVLGWFWLFANRMVYVFAFALALGIGLRQAKIAAGDSPYLIWLMAGIFTCNFITSMLGSGANVFSSRKKVIKQNLFPLSTTPTQVVLPQFIIMLIFFVLLMIYSVIRGEFPNIYWLQFPVILVLMFMFFYFFSLLASCFCALSKDVHNFIRIIKTPLFWVSGVIFDVSGVDIPAFKVFLLVNPVTFFVNALRDTFCFDSWFFLNIRALLCFGIVFLVIMILALHFYNVLKVEVCDAVR